MRKDMKKLFEILVLISLTTYAIFMSLPYFWDLIFQKDAIGLLDLNGYMEFINFFYINNIITGLTIVASVGLLFYKRWARTLFFSLIVIYIILAPFMGFAIAAGFESALSSINLLCNGAVLYMAYFSSVADEFKKTPNKPHNQDATTVAPIT